MKRRTEIDLRVFSNTESKTARDRDPRTLETKRTQPNCKARVRCEAEMVTAAIVQR